MPRPPLAQPLFFFSLLLVLGGAAGAVGSFWWTARWHERDVVSASAPSGETDAGDVSGGPADGPDDSLPLVADSEWENRAGWRWLIEPIPARGISASRGGAVSFARLSDGFEVFLARAEDSVGGPLAPRFAATALDENGAYLASVDMSGSASSNGVTLRRFRFWPGDADAERIARVGIEVLTPDAWRTTAETERKEALAAGIHTLPFPAIGEPYPFELDLPDGGTLRSQDYEGRVVLFDCWASWCVPCMEKMPDLRDAYAKYHERGLDIVGINLDVEPEAAERAIRQHAPDWPHVLVGAEDETVQAWREVTTIRSIPRFFLVDRRGVLRWDSTNVSGDELTRAVEECLAG